MSGRNGQRKPGTTRGSPRRSRTAKAARISRPAVKSRCASEWGGWGRLSVDGPGHYNPAPSEGPWGGGLLNPPRRWITESSARHRAGAPNLATESTKGGRKPNCRRGMPGAGFTWCCLGKAPSERPAFQPYWGKPAVRNDRGGRGNVGIIRSPVRASALPNCGGPPARAVPTATLAVGTGSRQFRSECCLFQQVPHVLQPARPQPGRPQGSSAFIPTSCGRGTCGMGPLPNAAPPCPLGWRRRFA
jgi:hypothetical protein